MTVQDGVALAIVAGAALYLVRRFTGWPRLGRRPPPPAPGVVLGSRLARGLARAEKVGAERERAR